jgi:hypothetical protein
MDRGDIRMVDAGCGPGFPLETAPGRFDGHAQGAHWAVWTVIRQQCTAHRAGSFGWGCCHYMLLATRILLYLAPLARGKNRSWSAGRERALP